MNIGIIGSGHIGGTLTRRFQALGHRVTVANSRGPQTLTSLTKRTVMSLVDAGTLDESWRQQPDTPVYGADLNAAKTRESLAAARP